MTTPMLPASKRPEGYNRHMILSTVCAGNTVDVLWVVLVTLGIVALLMFILRK